MKWQIKSYVCGQIISVYNSERIIKIGQYLPKLCPNEQELSCRKHIARQLRTRYVKGININPVTLKSRLRSLKVIQTGAIGKLVYHFLFVFYSNYGRIFSHLWDILHQIMTWPWKLGYGSFKVIENGAVRYTMSAIIQFSSYLAMNNLWP